MNLSRSSGDRNWSIFMAEGHNKKKPGRWPGSLFGGEPLSLAVQGLHLTEGHFLVGDRGIRTDGH